MDVEVLANQVLKAVKGYVASSLDPIRTRLAATETRVGALSMLLVKGQEAAKIPEFEDLFRRVRNLDDLEARVKALEDRR